MSDVFIYLLKVSAFTSIIYLFYWIALRHTTFHQLNRIYLLSGLCLSFILPLIHVPGYSLFNTVQVENLINNFDEVTFGETEALRIAPDNTIQLPDLKSVVLVLYILMGVFILRKSLKSICSIIKLKKSVVAGKIEDISFFYGRGIRQPFTFLKWIFIPSVPNGTTSDITILRHEKAHADQWHTLDLLFMETIITVLWFNPFVFFFRQSLKQVHEYLADHEAITAHGVMAEYLRLIVSNTRLTSPGIASQFYWSTLKKRITMITKNKSTRLHKLSYLLIIPVLLLTIMAFGSISFSGQMPLNKTENKPNMNPIKEGEYKISSGWGMRKHPITKEMKMHKAVDFKAKTGTEVLATADGKVVKIEFIEEGKGYGRMVLIQHGETYSTLYSQLSEFKVQVGDIVKQGDVVGLVGSSGQSTGPHLHYEVIKNGERVNPENYLE